MPARKLKIVKTITNLGSRRNSTSIQQEKRRFAQIKAGIDAEELAGSLAQTLNLKTDKDAGSLNFGESNAFKSPKACIRSRKLKKDSPIVLMAQTNTKLETHNMKSIEEEPIPCLLTELERPNRRFKRKLYEEFSNLPQKHFKSEMDLEKFLKNPAAEPDLHEQLVAKMTRVKEERINHVIAQFEEKINSETEELRVYSQLCSVLKKRRKKTDLDFQEIHALESSISEINANISELELMRNNEVERQKNVEYSLVQ